MKIFVTGGTGFIGARLVECLSESGHQLRCLARSSSNIDHLQAIGADIVIGDVTQKETLVGAMHGCDWLVHLAGNFELWLPDKQVYEAVNIEGVRNVMESALETGIKKVVHVSTVAVYGDAPWPVTEASPYGRHRSSRYAETKFQGDLIAWQMHEEQGLPLVMVYPSAVVGANDPKAAGRYIKNVATGRMPGQIETDSVFPFVYVGDVCQAISRALEKEGNVGEKYFVTAGNLTWGELNSMICEIAGSKLPPLHMPHAMTIAGAYALTAVADITKHRPLLDMSVDQIHLMHEGLQADGSKAERELGLRYTPIRQAVEEAVASYLN